MDVFYQMVHFDPSLRCSAKEVLLSPLFASLQRTYDEEGALEPKNELSASYMHYFRSPREGGSSVLPEL